jgi:hypothetical protein
MVDSVAAVDPILIHSVLMPNTVIEFARPNRGYILLHNNSRLPWTNQPVR